MQPGHAVPLNRYRSRLLHAWQALMGSVSGQARRCPCTSRLQAASRMRLDGRAGRTSPKEKEGWLGALQQGAQAGRRSCPTQLQFQANRTARCERRPTSLTCSPPFFDVERAWRAIDLTGLSRSTAWRLQRAGAFPKSVALSPGRVGWWESELTAWKKMRSCGSPSTPVAERPCTLPSKHKSNGLAGTLHSPATAMLETPMAERVKSRRRRLQVHPGQLDFGF